MTWQYCFFSELSVLQLYKILQLRNEVFVVEQQCIFQDADDKDLQCYHLMGWAGDALAAYTRLVPPGVIYPQASIGRVITAPTHRGKGSGKALMQQSITTTEKLFGTGPIKIGAQLYLKNFYEGFGFVQTGDVYDEDGINHIHMLRP